MFYVWIIVYIAAIWISAKNVNIYISEDKWGYALVWATLLFVNMGGLGLHLVTNAIETQK